MAVSPTGLLSRPLDDLKTMLSECAAFRSWVNAIDATAALAFIHIVGKKGAVPPFAIVKPGAWSRAMGSGGDHNYFLPKGNQKVYFEGAIHADNKDDDASAYYGFTNPIGAIVDELEDLGGGDGKLFLTALETDENAMRKSETKEAADGDRYGIEFLISWGLD